MGKTKLSDGKGALNVSIPKLDLLIRGGTVIGGYGARTCDVGIRGGVIVGLDDLDDVETAETIDAGGMLLLPGVVDEHVHPIYLDDPAYISQVALMGGVTTLMHFAYAKPGESLLEKVRELHGQALGGSVDFTIHAGMFDPMSQVAEVPAVADFGVRTFKVFMAYAAQGWMTDDGGLAALFRAAREVDGLVMVHCENGVGIDALERDAKDGLLGTDPVDMISRSRPPVLEAEAVSRAASLAEAFDAPLFVVHVTSARALAALSEAQMRGVRVVGETCPQYLTLTASAMRRYGALAKIGPPLRTDADRRALWGGIQSGALQTIGSDHVPKKTPADREQPLLEAGFGAPQLETMLSVVYDEGVAGELISVQRLVQLMSEHPARVFGLWPRKGRIGLGADADLVVWDPSARRVLASDGHRTRAGYSLYAGREVVGAATAVIAHGRVMVRNGRLRDEAMIPEGRFLRTGPFDMFPARSFPTQPHVAPPQELVASATVAERNLSSVAWEASAQ
jgi:dihydropyrimidinase